MYSQLNSINESFRMSDLSARQERIISLAREIGRVTVDDLAQRYVVTPQSIRRDLNEIAELGLLQRVHGGAVLASGTENVGYEARRMLSQEEKRRIGIRTAALVPDNCSLFINIGTTTEEVARALVGRRGLMVVTNNLNVANILHRSPGAEVIIAGGVVRGSDGGIVGEQTADFIDQFKLDLAVIGASAIDEEGALLDYDYREVRVARAIIANARRILLAADHSKFARAAPVRIAHISQTDTFVTDTAPPDAVRALCAQHGVSITLA